MNKFVFLLFQSLRFMEQIIKIDSVSQYNQLRGVPTLHPLITVIDMSKAKAIPAQTFNFGLYAIYLKELKCGEIKYGRRNYDFQDGTLVFTAPGQIVGVQPTTTTFVATGWALLFHPDLIKGTPLGKHIHSYSFFSYDVNEALHLSEKERQMVLDAFAKIQYEIEQSIDKHSKMLITSNIELFLNYCIRFYDRQFITREDKNKGILEKFEALIDDYLDSTQLQTSGLPSVSFCADKLNLSANYFGDLIKNKLV